MSKFNLEPSKTKFEQLLALYNSGNLEGALAAISNLLQPFPRSLNLLNLKGAILRAQGRFVAAAEVYQEALKHHPDHPELLLQLGESYLRLKAFQRARDAFKKASMHDHIAGSAYLGLGHSFKCLEDYDAALASYYEAARVCPKDSRAYENICAIIERRNNTSELRKVIDRATSLIGKPSPVLEYYRSKVAYRDKEYDLCIQLLNHACDLPAPARVKTSLFELRGKANHEIGEYQRAFDDFATMNKLAKNTDPSVEIAANQYLSIFESTAKELKSLPPKHGGQLNFTGLTKQPVFLVGFPRSGTTLLDSILRSHPQLLVLEERNLMDKCRASLHPSPNVKRIESLSQSDLNDLQRTYFAEASKLTKLNEGQTLIDKYPLNVIHMPLICNIFPKAKFVFSLRHPMDVILSCFMQNFRLNGAMANMLDIDQIARLYNLVMTVFKDCEARYKPAVHYVRYENIISNFDTTIDSVLEFIGVPWHQSVRAYHQTAKDRASINTPSYDQVTQPLYSSAQGRWRKYENHLESTKPAIAKWMQELGYED